MFNILLYDSFLTNIYLMLFLNVSWESIEAFKILNNIRVKIREMKRCNISFLMKYCSVPTMCSISYCRKYIFSNQEIKHLFSIKAFILHYS